MSEPLFKHDDCAACRYLGEYEGADLYVHEQNEVSQDEYVIRRSSVPHDYSSFPEDCITGRSFISEAMEPYIVAMKRARRGIPTEPTYYASTKFSGVGFAMPGQEATDIPTDGFALAPYQVDPEVREHGETWMAERADHWFSLKISGDLTLSPEL